MAQVFEGLLVGILYGTNRLQYQRNPQATFSVLTADLEDGLCVISKPKGLFLRECYVMMGNYMVKMKEPVFFG